MVSKKKCRLNDINFNLVKKIDKINLVGIVIQFKMSFKNFR